LYMDDVPWKLPQLFYFRVYEIVLKIIFFIVSGLQSKLFVNPRIRAI
jgi:hypothetical protein